MSGTGRQQGGLLPGVDDHGHQRRSGNTFLAVTTRRRVRIRGESELPPHCRTARRHVTRTGLQLQVGQRQRSRCNGSAALEETVTVTGEAPRIDVV